MYSYYNVKQNKTKIKQKITFFQKIFLLIK